MIDIGGLDLRWTLSADIPAGGTLKIACDHSLIETVSGCYFVVGRDAISNLLYVSAVLSDDTVLETYPHTTEEAGDFRLLMHDDFATVYVNGTWMHTFSFDYVNYSATPNITFTSSYSVTLSDVVLSELKDWREAIYVDIESNTENAIGSIVQERPILRVPAWDGSTRFFYTPKSRDHVDVDANIIDVGSSHKITYGNSGSASSDAIVYYSDVSVVIDRTAARDIGFVTRMMRLSNLDSGAIEAAEALQLRARQSREMHSLSLSRLLPDLEPEDEVRVSYSTPGSGTPVVESFVAEKLQIKIDDKGSRMGINGRSSKTTYSPVPRSS